MIAHDTQHTSWMDYDGWIEHCKIIGDVTEYQFRRQFSIPVHIPWEAIKKVFLFLAEDVAGELFSTADGWYVQPYQSQPFEWPGPFIWPLLWLD